MQPLSTWLVLRLTTDAPTSRTRAQMTLAARQPPSPARKHRWRLSMPPTDRTRSATCPTNPNCLAPGPEPITISSCADAALAAQRLEAFDPDSAIRAAPYLCTG